MNHLVGTVGHNNLDLAEQEELLLDWADDDEQDYKILLAFWDSFPGFPSEEELEILKRKAKEQFPISHAPPAKPSRNRKKAGMVWNVARVQEVEARAIKRGG